MSVPDEYPIGNLSVRFPYEPYEVQKAYMSRVLNCLQERKFGLLESPTGTGKTLSLLCASLAWLENERLNNRPVQTNSFQPGADADIQALLNGASAASLQGGSTWGKGPGGGPARCRIIYASRTHSQLAQVIGEFQRSPYQNVASVILASREQLCINDSVTSAVNVDRNQMCRLKIKTKTCEYYNNIERQADLDLGGCGATGGSVAGDIEALRKNGQKRKVCPYYASRELSTRADIIFLPYNYLVDPRIRKTLSVDLAESVVIIDEAHNVLRIFEDSSSISFTAKEVAVSLSEIDYLIGVMENQDLAAGVELGPDLDTSQVYILKDCLSKFESNLIDFDKKCPKPRNDNDPPNDFTGDVIVDVFNEAGINSTNAGTVCLLIGQTLDSLSTIATSGGPQKGKGLTKISEVIDLLFLNHQVSGPVGGCDFTREKMKKFYRFHIERKLDQGKVTTNSEFHLWCFHPGFSLQSLIRCNIRTLILTSGTLKPLESFRKELDADFPILLQNDHVIDARKQICYQVISRGPDNTELISTYQSRNNPKYLSSLGQAIVEIARRVPDGLLVFFASYAWMDACVNNWQMNGQWERLVQIKPSYVETKDKNVLNRNVAEYRHRVSSGGGACFMAVCRGKLSEGIDFSDRDARAVVITGIPYPSVRDAKVTLKKKFLDNMKFSQKQDTTLSGAEWYNLEAFRAVNQAIGRVIRHKSDFGAVLLLDKRFAQESCSSKLPSWLQKSVHETVFRSAMNRLDDFYSATKHLIKADNGGAKPRQPRSHQGSSIGLLPTSSLSSSSSMKRSAQSQQLQQPDQPAVKKKKIVIRQRTTAESDGAADPSSDRKEPSVDLLSFVTSLREKLAKPDLKILLQCIKGYRDEGDSELLFKTLKTYLDNSLLSDDDVSRFRAFVRPKDENDFNKIVSS